MQEQNLYNVLKCEENHSYFCQLFYTQSKVVVMIYVIKITLSFCMATMLMIYGQLNMP